MRTATTAVVLGILLVAMSSARSEPWMRSTWVSFSMGSESERILERAPLPVSIPSDYFVGIQPGVTLSRSFPAGLRLEFDGTATFERFYHNGDRRLVGGALNAGISQRFATRWRWRAALEADRFDDSIDETLNRSRYGGDLALGHVTRRTYGEISLGLSHRRFHDLYIWDSGGGDSPYREHGAAVGVMGVFSPTHWLELSGAASRQTTHANDPGFDSTTRLALAGVRFLEMRPLALFTSALYQERGFPDWSDTYRQIGLGATYPLSGGLDMSLRYARGWYESSGRDTDGIWKLTLAATWRPGGETLKRALPPLPGTPPSASNDAIHVGDRRLFRMRAPEARHVSLVGDFNHWNPRVHPMRQSGEGWWEVSTSLPSGSHQYAYWVDGILVPPPESEVMVDDGFGGRNGVVHVEPGGM